MIEKLQLLPVEVFPVQPRQQHVPVPKLSLVRHVVNREDRSNVAVFQAVELIEAARLVAAGHEKNVGPRFDAMRGLVGERELHRNLIWMIGL